MIRRSHLPQSVTMIMVPMVVPMMIIMMMLMNE